MELAERLAQRTLELIDIPSVSREEGRIAEHVLHAVPRGSFSLVYNEGDCFLFATGTGAEGRPLVILAGHLDTVPPQANLPGRLADGVVHGLGASDMKSGLAVMLELAEWLERERPRTDLDLGLLFFAREELAASESPLPHLFEHEPLVLSAGLVVMLEPTDNTIQAGCLGNLNARLTFRGESAHSARPWLGVNAIERALDGLPAIAAVEPEEVVVDGLPFREVLSLTGLEAGIADNVIPDRAVARLNFRYAPNRSVDEAEARLRELAAPSGGALEIVSNSPPAHVALGPLAERLQSASGFELEPKQAWTPVAEFASRGLDAINLGPGATRFAHRRDEQVEVTALVRAFEALQRFVTAS
jgi:succinyl-diaminopimelate desuccinylase